MTMRFSNLLWLPVAVLTCGLAACERDVLPGTDAENQQELFSTTLSFDVVKGIYGDGTRAPGDWTAGENPSYIFFSLHAPGGFHASADAYYMDDSKWHFQGNMSAMTAFTGDGCKAVAHFFKPATIEPDRVLLGGLAGQVYASDSVDFRISVQPQSILFPTNDALVLNPSSGRIRFSGTAGTRFLVDGLMAYTQFSRSECTFTDEATMLSDAVVTESGFSEYLYAHFPAESRELLIVYPDYFYIFSKLCGDNVLLPGTNGAKGKSGFISLPTADSHNSWVVFTPASVEASTHLLSFAGYATAPKSFTVTADGDFEISPSESWIHYDLQKGNESSTVAVTVDENTATLARDAFIVLKRTGRYGKVATDTVAVHQLASSGNIDRGSWSDDEDWDQLTQGNLQVAAHRLSFDHNAATESVEVLSTFDFSASSSNPSWLSAEAKADGKNRSVTITVAENKTASARQAEVRLLMVNPVNANIERRDTIHVSQDAYPRGVVQVENVLELNFSFQQQTSARVKVIHTYDFSLSKKSNSDWLTINPDGDYFTLSLTENEGSALRRDTVVVSMLDPIYNETLSVEIPVTQDFCNVKIDFDDYGDDEDWDTGASSDSDVGRDDYGEDEDWDTGASSDSDVGRDDYGEDEDYDKEEEEQSP